MIDSLVQNLDLVSGKEKVHLLNKIGKAYWGISTEKTLEYSNSALKLSQELKYLKGEAQSLNNIGVGYYYIGEYERSLDYFLRSLDLRKELGEKKDIVSSLNNIGIIYDDLNNFSKAMEYYIASLDIYEELKDKNGIAISLHNIGVVYENQSNYNKALEYLLRALIYYQEISDKKGEASSLGNIGIIYKDLSNYDKAIEYHLESLKISKEISDKIGIARALDNIGIIYDNLGDYDKAIDYYQQSLDIEQLIGDKQGVAGSYNNIGIIYDDRKDYEKALEYYFLSLDIYKETNDRNGIANTYNNIGVVLENQERFETSLEYHLNAMQIFEEIGHKKGYAASLNNIASVYLKIDNYEQAKIYFNRSLEVAEKIEIKDLIIEIYQKLSDLYILENNYPDALKFYKLYSQVKDSIFTKEKFERIAGMQTTYEVEQLIQQQQQEIELLQKDNEIYRLEVEKHILNKWRLYSGLFLFLIMIAVIYYLYRIKYRANIKLEKQVEERTKDLKIINEQLKKEISERKKIENQLIRSERLAGIGELAAGVAHEIRNPLGNISSSARYCLSKYKLSKQVKQYLEIIMEDSERANSIIKGLLDFASPRELALKTESIIEIVEGILNSVQARCLENNIKIIRDFTDNIPQISVDKKWLGRALLNLVVNAIQAMSQEGEIKISILNIPENDEIRIIILDTGSGISVKNLKRIFDPFFTTRADGVGLGLSLAHQIITDHNGTLYIESKLKQGTRVMINFPVISRYDKGKE